MRYKLNISIDDVSPHPKSSLYVLNNCIDLINTYPDIKFTLFVPTAYWRTMPSRVDTRTSGPLELTNHKTFCENLLRLPSSNFEICYHGHFHGIPGKSNNDEFQHFTEKESTERFQLMLRTAAEAGLGDLFKSVFRPPAWRMSPGSIRAAKSVGINTLALSPKEYARLVYAGEEENFKNVVFYDCNPPFDVLGLFEKTEIVYHACEWDKNYLSSEKAKELKAFIGANEKDIDFCFIEELV